MRVVPRLGSGIPLVARVKELRQLLTAYSRAKNGEANAVLLAGDAGVGKTRLLSELAQRTSEEDGLVLTGRCLDVGESGLPYLPFAEALAPLLEIDDDEISEAVRSRSALGRLLPQIELTSADNAKFAQVTVSSHNPIRQLRTERDLGQLQLFDAVLAALTDIAAHRPVVLILEDLHWAEGSTRDLLSFLLSRLRNQRLLIVASYRDEDVFRRHPLRALLAELVRLSSVNQIELKPLSPHDSRFFIEALAETPLSPNLLNNVVSRSQGNPFFAEELLASAGEHGELPTVLVEVFLARLERLSAETRQVLRVVSVANGPVSHGLLSAIVSFGETQLEEALREAVHHHVLVIEQGFYLFRHALLQEAVYGDLLPGERGRLHAAYATQLAAQPAARGQDALLAQHSLRSNDLPTALSSLLRAAREAEELGAPGTALRHSEQALEIWDAVPEQERPSEVDELELLSQASRYAATSGEPERSIAYARSATQVLTPQTDFDRAAWTWRRLAKVLLTREGTEDEAVIAIERAWELVENTEPSAVRAWVLATRAAILRFADKPEEALESARASVADAQAAGIGGAEASALVTLGTLADSAGNVEEAREWLRQAEVKAIESGALNVEVRALYFRAFSHDDQADIPAAIELYRRGVERAEQIGLNWNPMGMEVRARYLYLRYISGDWPETRETEHPGREVSDVVSARIAAVWVALLVARGQFAAAKKLIPDLRPQWHIDMQIPMAGAAAEIELAYWQGNHAVAAQRTQEVIDWLQELQPWLLGGIRLGTLGLASAVAQAEAARIKGDQSAVTEAVKVGEAFIAHIRQCAEDGLPRTGTLGPEGIAWLARADATASGLNGVSDVKLWEKAVTAFSYGAVYEQAICRWHYAEALLGADASEAAAKQLHQAHSVATQLEAKPLLTAIQALAQRARVDFPGLKQIRPAVTARSSVLTDREHSVLELVALGRTNRQIGAALYISEKTVSVHLSRVMAKLGVARRAEAVATAYDRGLLTKPAESPAG